MPSLHPCASSLQGARHLPHARWFPDGSPGKSLSGEQSGPGDQVATVQGSSLDGINPEERGRIVEDIY